MFGRRKSKKRQLVLNWPSWQKLFSDDSALPVLLSKGYKEEDVLEQFIVAFQQGGSFLTHGTAARQQALGFLKRHGVAMCRGATVDAIRKLYEVVSEQSARPADDGIHGAGRLQVLALDALTVLLVGLHAHENDPRIFKVHVQRLYKDLDPRTAPPQLAGASSGNVSSFTGSSGGSFTGAQHQHAATEVHHRVAASDCLRYIELAFPGMLLAGGGRLLDLSLAEAESATPAATQLVIAVLSHGAGRYLAQQAAAAAAVASIAPEPALGLPGHLQVVAPNQRSGAGGSSSQRAGSSRGEGSSSGNRSSCASHLAPSTQPSVAGRSVLSNLIGQAVFTADGYSDDGHDGPTPFRPVFPLPAGEAASSSSKGLLPAGGLIGGSHASPASPSGVVSPASRVTGSGGTSGCSSNSLPVGAAAAATAAAPRAAAAAAPAPRTAGVATGPASPAVAAQPGVSGSGGAAFASLLSAGLSAVPERAMAGEVQLLSKSATGLRHFYVPEYYKGSDPPGLEGCQLVLTPEGKQRLQQAVPHFLRLLPRVVPEDLPQTCSLLAPLLRVAECSPDDIKLLLEKHLRSNNLSLLQAVLMLLDEVPSVYQPWQDSLVDQLVRILVGRSAPEQRAAALGWLLRRHHQQRYAKEPSLFEVNWRAALPAAHDDVLLITLKVKTLTACIASGIGDAWEVAEALNAWEGFWAPSPSPQQLRAAAYVLRMLCYAECPTPPSSGGGTAVGGGECAGCLGNCNEARLKAIVVAVVVQMAATRPHYLPAVESFMLHCGPEVRAVILAALNVLFAAAAPPLLPARTAARRLPSALLRQGSSHQTSASTNGPNSSTSERRLELEAQRSERSVGHSSGELPGSSEALAGCGAGLGDARAGADPAAAVEEQGYGRDCSSRGGSHGGSEQGEEGQESSAGGSEWSREEQEAPPGDEGEQEESHRDLREERAGERLVAGDSPRSGTEAAATQGEGSDTKGSSRAPSNFASPEPQARQLQVSSARRGAPFSAVTGAAGAAATAVGKAAREGMGLASQLRHLPHQVGLRRQGGAAAASGGGGRGSVAEDSKHDEQQQAWVSHAPDTPQPTPFAAAAEAAGRGSSNPSSSPAPAAPIAIGRGSSNSLASPGRSSPHHRQLPGRQQHDQGWEAAGTPTARGSRQEPQSPSLTSRLSSSLPALIGRLVSLPLDSPRHPQHRPQQQKQLQGQHSHPPAGRLQKAVAAEPQGDLDLLYFQQQQEEKAEAQQGQQQGGRSDSPPLENMDRATRAALIRSASFSAVAAAAGWIKAQHWLMNSGNHVLGLSPMPPDTITSWPQAEAWLLDERTWTGLATFVLRHDAMLYRTLLLQLVQAPALCPLGALSFLELYARRYVGELPGDALSAPQVGSALLAICQATVMTHLFDPASPNSATVAAAAAAAIPARGNSTGSGGSLGSSSGGSPGVGGRGESGAAGGWSDEQKDVAEAVQSLLAVLSTMFPVEKTRHKAGAFLQHLSAATAASQPGEQGGGWQLVRQLLGVYLAEAISAGSSPPS
ncbi:hypothetical protein N2152v2_003331 [Parachlorella kessleri]